MKTRLLYWLNFFKTYKNWPTVLAGHFFQLDTDTIFLKNGIKIFSPKNSSTPVISDEIFVLKRYTLDHDCKIEKKDIVVDIGAHCGVFSLYAFKMGAAKIFAYEPSHVNYKFLLKNILANRAKNIFPRNIAVTNKRGRVILCLAKQDGQNSLFIKKNISATKNFKEVASINLEDILIKEKLTSIDFLKIDCEGSEGLIFKSNCSRILKKIKKISMEYHDNLSPIKHSRIIHKLISAGFVTKTIKSSNYMGYIYAWRSSVV